MGVVYKITNRLNGKAYVGITSQPLNWRINAHRSAGRKGKRYAIAKAIQAHGFENFHVEVLFESDDYDALKSTECRLIDEHGTFGSVGGYNLTRGGDGTVGWTATPEQRAALSAGRKGRTATQQARANMTEAARGRVVSTETRSRIAASLRGRPHSPERIAAIVAGKQRSAS